jgi:hypothetical protein
VAIVVQQQIMELDESEEFFERKIGNLGCQEFEKLLKNTFFFVKNFT